MKLGSKFWFQQTTADERQGVDTNEQKLCLKSIVDQHKIADNMLNSAVDSLRYRAEVQSVWPNAEGA